MKTMSEFFTWEASTRDVLDFKKTYVDMAGDVMAGLMLSELVYWHLPDKDGNSRLRVKHEARFWVACRRYEWWDRCRMKPRQADRAGRILERLGLVTRDVFKFNGEPTIHYSLNESAFLAAWNKVVQEPAQNPFQPKREDCFDETVKTKSPLGENVITEKGIPLTEITSETTSGITEDAAAATTSTSSFHSRNHKERKPLRKAVNAQRYQEELRRSLSAAEEDRLAGFEKQYPAEWVSFAMGQCVFCHPTGMWKPLTYIENILKSLAADQASLPVGSTVTPEMVIGIHQDRARKLPVAMFSKSATQGLSRIEQMAREVGA